MSVIVVGTSVSVGFVGPGFWVSIIQVRKVSKTISRRPGIVADINFLHTKHAMKREDSYSGS